uniref:N-acetyltransferase domain-containing protein n=1 Tax=Chrysotila carterae TaxID=13221 RepID=A0A7S4B6I5_CHRCT|mmetsp:Transcript_1441/g.2804  ORF Transcript_1441/g.2804 Transcript_1441/m.2804 type:complete len:172 (+) Transcript_1441:288-803(+)|eukprot:6213172-Pleurochrysis_carterae.AAC.2
MTTQRRFSPFDLLKFNNVNLDPLTETYQMSFYLQYLAKWPQYCVHVHGPHGRSMGYILGKAEGVGEDWHGHVTAVTVPPEYRRLGVAVQLMDLLERVSEWDNGYFVDLFVRQSNGVAINFYKKLGYSIYRRVLGYYSGSEDAYDMRKALSRDVEKKSIVPLPHPVDADELD